MQIIRKNKIKKLENKSMYALFLIGNFLKLQQIN